MGEVFEELPQLQENFSDYKIIVFVSLNPDRDMFTGKSFSAKNFYLLFVNGHFNVISNLKGISEKKYILKVVTIYMTNARKFVPCVPLHHTLRKTKYCRICNRRFLSEKCFQTNLTLKVKGKLVCQWRQICRNCS